MSNNTPSGPHLVLLWEIIVAEKRCRQAPSLCGQALANSCQASTQETHTHTPTHTHTHMSGGGNLLPKFMPILFFRRASRFWGVQDTWRSNKESPSVYWGLPCLVPWWPQMMQIRISFWSRSGCWPFLGFFVLSRFTGLHLFLWCFRQKWRTPVFALFS